MSTDIPSASYVTDSTYTFAVIVFSEMSPYSFFLQSFKVKVPDNNNNNNGQLKFLGYNIV